MLKIIPIYILAFASICFISSCKKEDKNPKGNSNAQLNGTSWYAETVSGEPSRFGVNNLIDIYIIQNADKDISNHLSFGNILKTFTLQTLLKKTGNVDTPEKAWVSYITSQDYDLTGDEYTLLESDTVNNWLQITSADDNFSKNIKGNFSATLYRTHTYQSSPNPDTIRLRNGTFYISKLKE